MINKDTKTKIQEIFAKEIKFIEAKRELLLNGKNIIILEPMTKERRRRIYKIVKKYPDIAAFNIGEDGNKQIVFRYNPFTNKYVDVKTLIKTGNQAYYEGNYDECLNCYTKLLQFGRPKAHVYAKIGLSLLKKGYKKTAIDYLTVATHLNKEEQTGFDFTDLINELRGISDDENQKPYCKIEIEEFENDKENYYYDIDQLQEITLYSLGANIDVESACQRLGMTEEQIDIIRLMYAKEYYSQGDYTKGDKFLKVVEQSKNKTEVTKNLLEEIRKSKKFYINRSNPNSNRLTLSLKPKK